MAAQRFKAPKAPGILRTDRLPSGLSALPPRNWATDIPAPSLSSLLWSESESPPPSNASPERDSMSRWGPGRGLRADPLRNGISAFTNSCSCLPRENKARQRCTVYGPESRPSPEPRPWTSQPPEPGDIDCCLQVAWSMLFCYSSLTN